MGWHISHEPWVYLILALGLAVLLLGSIEGVLKRKRVARWMLYVCIPLLPALAGIIYSDLFAETTYQRVLGRAFVPPLVFISIFCLLAYDRERTRMTSWLRASLASTLFLVGLSSVLGVLRLALPDPRPAAWLSCRVLVFGAALISIGAALHHLELARRNQRLKT